MGILTWARTRQTRVCKIIVPDTPEELYAMIAPVLRRSGMKCVHMLALEKTPITRRPSSADWTDVRYVNITYLTVIDHTHSESIPQSVQHLHTTPVNPRTTVRICIRAHLRRFFLLESTQRKIRRSSLHIQCLSSSAKAICGRKHHLSSPAISPRVSGETTTPSTSNLRCVLGPHVEHSRRTVTQHKNLQPSHSYKYRGISHFIQRALATYGPTMRVVCASGGNAGLAAACAAQMLGVPCAIYLPQGVDARTHAFLHNVGAEVVVAGRFYLESLRAAEAAAQTQPDTCV